MLLKIPFGVAHRSLEFGEQPGERHLVVPDVRAIEWATAADGLVVRRRGAVATLKAVEGPVLGPEAGWGAGDAHLGCDGVDERIGQGRVEEGVARRPGRFRQARSALANVGSDVEGRAEPPVVAVAQPELAL